MVEYEDGELVSRREHDLAVEHLHATIDNLAASITDRAELEDKARIMQAAEYQRRLEILNHEAKRIREAAEKAVLRDVFEPWQTMVSDFIAESRAVSDTNQQGAATDARTTALVISAIGVLVALAAVIIAVWGAG